MAEGAYSGADHCLGPARPSLSISVVTPSFNQRDFIESTLRSVVTQGYRPLEYVVIDGGSTDGSVEIIRRYEHDLGHWVSEPDRGHADALNKGFAHTSGDIMCWINSSDMYYPWTFETVAQIFSQLPHVEWITGVPTEFGSFGGPKWIGESFHNVYDFLAGNDHGIQQESVFWRRGLWERAGGSLDANLRFTADFDLWLRFFRLAELYHVPTPLGGFRVHEDRLGATEEYLPESALLMSAYVAGQNRRTLRRARAIRTVGARYGQNHLLERALRRFGLCRWYRHASVVYDHSAGSWTVL